MAMTNDEIIHDAFVLGAQIVELKSRIQLARADLDDFSLQTASVWRSIVNRITVLQIKAFPDSCTTNTLYEPPDQEGLPYLYPPAPDYGNVGISGNDNTGSPILENFKLYDVTRRAINCLTLLYIKEKESLIPRVIKENKTHLINAILQAGKDVGGGGGAEQTSDNTHQMNEGGEEANADQFPTPVTDLEKAIAILTERTVKFLEAWDGYLRENYYAGGLIPDDDSELVAYEAGHSMSLLSWGVSLATVVYELKPPAETPQLKEKLLEAWQYVFRDEAVIRLQHQVSALSTALDEAYIKQQQLKLHEGQTTFMVATADLPSQAISAVKHGLDYWHRTVKWISVPANEKYFRNAPVDTHWSKKMRMALIEQTNIWQTLLTGQQSLKAFTLESITQSLMQNITTSVQESLQENFKGGLHQAQAAVKELAGEVKDAITETTQSALNGLEEMVKSYKKIIIPVGVVLAIIFVILVVAAIAKGGEWVGATGGTGVAGLLAGLMGYLGIGNANQTRNAKKEDIIKTHENATSKIEQSANAAEADKGEPATAGHSLMSRIETAGNEAGKMLLEAINKGYAQIQVELAGLGRSAAVAYPLIEFFTFTFNVKSDIEFFTFIIWSNKEREEELSRILSAAFGPMALLINPKKNKKDEIHEQQTAGDNTAKAAA